MNLNVETKPGLAYFVGGLIAALYLVLGYFLLSFNNGVNFPLFLFFYVIAALTILFILSRVSSYLGLGFLIAIFVPIYWFLLLVIELTIHPPSE